MFEQLIIEKLIWVFGFVFSLFRVSRREDVGLSLEINKFHGSMSVGQLVHYFGRFDRTFEPPRCLPSTSTNTRVPAAIESAHHSCTVHTSVHIFLNTWDWTLHTEHASLALFYFRANTPKSTNPNRTHETRPEDGGKFCAIFEES